MVFQIHQYILSLPQQVRRSQPIYFTDAFGKEAPFHLEFVYSAEVCKVHLRMTRGQSSLFKVFRFWKIG